jgi:glycosyltransferase involved in cell wall biosynthesis
MTECRVLALLPFLVKGALSLEVFRAMPDRGVDVTVAFSGFSLQYAPDEMEDFIARDRLIDVSTADMGESFEVIRKAIEERRIDLVVQVGATPLYPCLPRWKESSPQLRIADILYNEIGHTLNHFLYERCIDAVIVESESMARYARRASRKAQSTIELVRSGVDLERFRPRNRPPSDGSPITVGYIGRMSPEKNPLGFVDLAERLLALDTDLAFRMAGAGPGATEVEQRLGESPYRDRIFYAGFVDSLRSELHAIDVLILPSKLDGRPVIVMEANACGIPVVAAPVGGVPELIDEGVNGYLLHPEDTGPIHELLSTWKRSPETLRQLRRSAREYACRMFDRERMMDDYAHAFRRIATSFDATSLAAG